MRCRGHKITLSEPYHPSSLAVYNSAFQRALLTRLDLAIRNINTITRHRSNNAGHQEASPCSDSPPATRCRPRTSTTLPSTALLFVSPTVTSPASSSTPRSTLTTSSARICPRSSPVTVSRPVFPAGPPPAPLVSSSPVVRLPSSVSLSTVTVFLCPMVSFPKSSSRS